MNLVPHIQDIAAALHVGRDALMANSLIVAQAEGDWTTKTTGTNGI